jgi:protein KRI1
MYLKDYHRRNLLEGDTEEEQPQAQRITTYEQEQSALKEAFHTAIPSDGEEEEEIFRPKKKSKTDKSAEEEEYASFLASLLKDEASQNMFKQFQSLASKPSAAGPPTGTEPAAEEGEAFLAKYLLNRGWLDPESSIPELYEDASSDEEKAENFETAYNFRFEAPGGTDIVTHARTISSTRRGDEKRKHERERKKAQKEEERRREMEEIARLRNLKRMELEERLRRVEGVAGTRGWTEKDLEGDFDSEEWDERMQGVFNENYYNDVCFPPLWMGIDGRRIRRNPSLRTISISRISYLKRRNNKMSMRWMMVRLMKMRQRRRFPRNSPNGRKWTRNERSRNT